MNTLEPNWVDTQFQKALSRRTQGTLSSQPRIRTTTEFAPLFSSNMFQVSRGVFMTRMRSRAERYRPN